MFRKFNLVTGILALLLFSYAQHHGWSMFENVASSSRGGSGSGGRIYHK